MIKFGRNYLIKFKIGRKSKSASGSGINITWLDEITIGYPLTVQFNVTRSNFQEFDTCTLRLTNLKESTRSKLYKDIYEDSKYIEIQLFAGYGDDVSALPMIYYGEVYECYSWKQGAGTDFFTDIRCLDGVVGGTYSQSNVVFEAGTQPIDIVRKLCNDIGYPLRAYSQGILSEIPPLKKKCCFMGNSLKLLKTFVTPLDSKGKSVKIMNGGIYIVGKNAVLPKEALVVSAEGGLLGYPKRRQQYIELEILFEPRIQTCEAVELVSSIDNFFNGLWKCVSFSHTGVISGAVNGQCTTKIGLFTDDISFNWMTEVKNG